MMIRMSLKLLLTMCFGCIATGPNNLTVIQTPRKILLSVGDYIKITCIWEKDIVRHRVNWYLVNKENITEIISSELVCVSNSSHEKEDVLVIKSASVNDTGFYYCEIIIEIPFYKKLYGNGTTVTAEDKVADAHLLKKKVWMLWAIIPVLLALGGFSLCYKNQHSTPSGAAQLLMLTEKNEEEQVLEVAELHGTYEPAREAAEENSSYNSAKWVVSTLYESLEFLCNESTGKDDKSTRSIVPNAVDEPIPQTRAAEKSRTRQESVNYFDIQN